MQIKMMLKKAASNERHWNRHTTGQRNVRVAAAGISGSKRESNVAERRRRGLQVQRGPVATLGEEADKHGEHGRERCPWFEREIRGSRFAKREMGAKGSARRRYNREVRLRQRRGDTIPSASRRHRLGRRRRWRRFQRQLDRQRNRDQVQQRLSKRNNRHQEGKIIF